MISDRVQTAVDDFLELGDGLTCLELARRTPGYEVGDIIRFVAHLRMSALSRSYPDGDVEENTNGKKSFTNKSFALTFEGDKLLRPTSQDFIPARPSVSWVSLYNEIAHNLSSYCQILLSRLMVNLLFTFIDLLHLGSHFCNVVSLFTLKS